MTVLVNFEINETKEKKHVSDSLQLIQAPDKQPSILYNKISEENNAVTKKIVQVGRASNSLINKQCM
jgi:hypothetical protein